MESRLPQLGFGDRRAIIARSETDFVNVSKLAKRPIDDMAFTSSVKVSKISGISVGSITFGAVYSGPMRLKTYADPQVMFMLPIIGSGTYAAGTRVTPWRASRSIIQSSHDRPMLLEAEGMMAIAIRADAGHLIHEFNAMTGQALEDDYLLSSGCKVLAGEQQGIDYYNTLMKIGAMIDGCDGNVELLERIGLEDVVYRVLAAMLSASGGREQVSDGAIRLPRSSRAIDAICHHIRHNPGRPLTIPGMERMTGLSGRALNYAFQKHFDCSPQEWQRNHLLDEARKRLSRPGQSASIKKLSYELGFSSPSSFTAHYKQRFNELPSDTAGSLTMANGASSLEEDN